MRATVMYKAHDVRIENVPDPAIVEPTDAIIRVTRACICGSDLWPYNDGPNVEGQRQPVPHRCPECEMPACGVPDQDRAREIQTITRGIGSQPVNCRADILECARITSARLVRAPIADAPDCDSAARQLCPNVPQLLASSSGHAPASTMDKNCQWMRTIAARKEQVSGL
jgi:hypothetical protein